MAFMRIYCNSCGGKWEIYDSHNWTHKANRTCPHCCREIDLQTWYRQILPAFGAVSDANRELYKDFCGYDNPLFRFDVISNPFIKKEDKTEND